MKTYPIEYKDENTLLEGYLAYKPKNGSPLSAVMIAPPWEGRNLFSCQKAEALAQLGYAGFAIDLYGKGIIGKNNEENSKLMQPFIEDRALLRRRLTAALNTVQKLDIVDKNRIAIIGFCFGGLCALDLARSGADIKGVVSFHGFLNAPEGLASSTIKAKILALHGYDDSMVPPDQIDLFAKEMTQAKADWQIHIYGNTMHAFTNPKANNPSFGTVYNAEADRRSWGAMRDFFAEILV